MRFRGDLQTFGGWGTVQPGPFAYDVTGQGLLAASRFYGVARYGEAPSGKGEADNRPYAFAFHSLFAPNWNAPASWQVVEGAASNHDYLTAVPGSFGGKAAIEFTTTDADNPHAFALPVSLAANESLYLRAFVNEPGDEDDASSKGHQWWIRLHQGGAGGVLLRICDGRPEVCRHAATWSRGDEAELRDLEQLESPTAAESQQMETLRASLYSSVTSLSFDSKLARDTWRNSLFGLTLLPQPDGVLNCVLDGGGATALELDSIATSGDAAGQLVNLWDACSIEVGATGGGWTLQLHQVEFDLYGSLEFGPFYLEEGGLFRVPGGEGFIARAQVFSHNGVGSVTFEITSYGELGFGFKAIFATSDPRYTPWLVALSAREANGPRTGLAITTPHLDTRTLPAPPSGSGMAAETDPVMDMRLTMSDSGRLSANVLLRSVNGSGRLDIDDIVNRVCNLDAKNVTVNAATRLLTQGLIAGGEVSNLKRFASLLPDGSLSNFPLYLHGSDTSLSLNVTDPWQILEETQCRVPIICDGLTSGASLRQYLRRAGSSDAEMNGVADEGITIPMPVGRQEWGFISDKKSTLASGIGGILDRFGYKRRFYWNGAAGGWVWETIPTTVVAAFTSEHTKNDPDLLRGGSRFIILTPLDWQRDHSNYYTDFEVVGGSEKNPIVKPWNDDYALTLLGGGNAHPRWTGRVKQYDTLVDYGLRTEGMVNYALRSLRWLYGRPGRTATFETYLHFGLKPYDRVTCDGVLCEVVSWQGTLSVDRMQLTVREIV